MQMITKNKKELMLMLLTAIILLIVGVVSFAFTGAITQAQAVSGTQLSHTTRAALEARMRSDYFIHEGTTFHINITRIGIGTFVQFFLQKRLTNRYICSII